MYDIIFKLDPSQSHNFTLARVPACGAIVRAKLGALNFKNGLTNLTNLLNFSQAPIKAPP